VEITADDLRRAVAEWDTREPDYTGLLEAEAE
jgi:hypothetical protein